MDSPLLSFAITPTIIGIFPSSSKAVVSKQICAAVHAVLEEELGLTLQAFSVVKIASRSAFRASIVSDCMTHTSEIIGGR